MRLIAVDWGTSSLRGALLDDNGRVLEEKSAALGILNVPDGDFPGTFDSLFGEWMWAPDSLCLISGMAGSRQGWAEAPYVPCPARLPDLARHLHWIKPNRIAIVPGLSSERAGVPDVMRGEEVQIFGAMRLCDIDSGVFVLPGTHSKWATVDRGKVTGFRTYMTGEFYALLSRHSILARTLQADAPLDEAAFLQGVARAGTGDGLLHNAFGVRALALFERLPPPESASYLSGLLIGEELRSQPLEGVGKIILIGTPELTARYSLALAGVGVETRSLGAAATWSGLHSTHRALVRLP